MCNCNWLIACEECSKRFAEIDETIDRGEHEADEVRQQKDNG